MAAIVCRLDSPIPEDATSEEAFSETLAYCVEKLQQGLDNTTAPVFNLKIFFSVLKFPDVSPLVAIVERFVTCGRLVYTFVPVIKLKREHTCLSICGVRNQ